MGDRSHDLVFKPEFSRFGVKALVGPEPYRLAANKPTPAQPWIPQQRIRGDDASFYAVAREGRLSAFCAYRARWRLPGGVAYAFAPVEPALAARLRAMADTLADRLVVDGQFACDLVIDAQGESWLIECTPRAVSGVHLFPPGADLANAILGRGEATVVDPSASAHIAPALWRHGQPAALREGRMGAWMRQRATGRVELSAPGDRGPVLGALMDSFEFSRRAAQGRRHPQGGHDRRHGMERGAVLTPLPGSIAQSWQLVALSREVKAKPLARVLAKTPIVLFRAGGRAVAFEDRCPHRNYPLSLGRVEGQTLQCAYHGWRFNADGGCVEAPGCTLGDGEDARVLSVSFADHRTSRRCFRSPFQRRSS